MAALFRSEDGDYAGERRGGQETSTKLRGDFAEIALKHSARER